MPVCASSDPGAARAPPLYTDCDPDGGLPTCCLESPRVALPVLGPGGLDAAGSITVGVSFLGMLRAGSAHVTLARTVVEKLVVPNGSVVLVGESQISGPAMLD